MVFYKVFTMSLYHHPSSLPADLEQASHRCPAVCGKINSALALACAYKFLVYSLDAESHPLSYPLSASLVWKEKTSSLWFHKEKLCCISGDV